jgi:RNA polymerase sigma factor (sigma-70 family)
MSDLSLSVDGTSELAPGGHRALSDELLARLVARGSERAFASLYERHHQAIYRYCRSILRNDHDAQEALQSTMMRAYAALGARDRELSLKPWLFRIAHNEAISILRRRRPEEAWSDERELSSCSVEGSLEVRERLSMLMGDLRTLPERQRAALVMHELSGLSVREIGTALEMSAGAVKQALFEARGALHERSEGRDMQCESVRRTISLRDGRMLRGRRIRAHLEACEECRRFRASMATRREDLAAIAPPLPAAAASGLLGELLGHGAGHATAGAAGTTLGGHAAAASLLGKGIAAAALVAAVAVGTVHVAVTSRHAGGTSPRPAGVGHRLHETSSAHESHPRSAFTSRALSIPAGSSVRRAHSSGAAPGASEAAPGAAASGQGKQSEARRAIPGHQRLRPGTANGRRRGHSGTHAGNRHAPRSHAPHSHGGAGGRAPGPQHGNSRSGHKRESGPAQRHGRPKHEQPASHAPEQGGSASSHAGSEGGRVTGGTTGSGHAQR